MIASIRKDQPGSAKRIASLTLGILAVLAASYLLLDAGFQLHDCFAIGQESVSDILLGEGIFVVLAGVLLFEAYRFVKYFFKKPRTHDP